MRRARPETAAPKHILTYGDLVFDHQRRKVGIAGKPVSLTPLEFKLLQALAYIEELNTAETAHRLGTNPTAVKLRLHRARKALGTLLSTCLSEQGRGLGQVSQCCPVSSPSGRGLG